MSADHDATEFIDDDFQPSQRSPMPAADPWATTTPAPTLNEVASQVAEKQQKLAELKRAQEELERERSALEETRRRQMEFQTGRTELLHNLARGIVLLEKSEVAARRDAELMARALENFKDALTKLQAIKDDAWTKENFNLELTRALTTIENARMEWNSARLKINVLANETGAESSATALETRAANPFAGLGFFPLCKIGLGLTWPLLVAVLALALFVALRTHH